MFSTQDKLYTPVHKACKLLPLLFTPLLSPFLGNPFSPPEKHELQGVNVTPGRTTLAGTELLQLSLKPLKEERPIRGLSSYMLQVAEQRMKWNVHWVQHQTQAH